MERARTDSLRHEIVLQQLEELLADYWVNMQARQSINPLHNNPEVYETAEALLRLQQCIRQLDYAPVPPRGSDGGRDDSRLLGVSEDDLRAAVASSSPHAQPVRLRAIIQGLIPELEGRLQRKCEMLLDVYPSSAGAHRPKASSSSSLTSSNLDRARASQLVKLLQIDLAETADLKQRSRRAEAALQRLRDEHFQCLAQTLQDLHTLLAKHRLRERFDHDDITCRWLKARLRATREKLQVMLGQLKLDIYTPGNIQALRRIKGHLDAEISKQQAELQAARAELQVYQNIGGEFEQLQQQYAEITAEIENKRWALKEFGSRS